MRIICVVLPLFTWILVASDKATEKALQIGIMHQMPPFIARKEMCMVDYGYKECIQDNAFEGYCKDLAIKLAQEMNKNYSLVLHSGYGEKLANGSWRWGFPETLPISRIDFGVSPLIMTEELAADFDLTPFFTSGMSAVIRTKQMPQKSIRSLNPYGVITWVAIFFMQIMSFATCYLLYKHLTLGGQPPARLTYKLYIFMFGIFVWVACSVFLMVSIVQHAGSVGRERAAEAAAARNVTVLETLDDLLAQDEIKFGVAWYKNNHPGMNRSDSRQALVADKRVENFIYPFLPNGIKKMKESEGRYALILDDHAVRYEVAQSPCDTKRLGPNLDTYQYAIATVKDSNMTVRVRDALKNLTEAGELDALYQKYFVAPKCPVKPAVPAVVDIDETEKVAVLPVMGMFLGICTTITASLVMMHVERQLGRLGGPIRFTDEIAPMYPPPSA